MKRRPTNRGFTFVEVMFVLVIISVVGLFIGRSSYKHTNTTKISIASTTIGLTIPKTLANAALAGGLSVAGDSNESALYRRGINPETPWGERWSVTGLDSNSSVDIRYPTGLGEGGFENAELIVGKVQERHNDGLISIEAKRELGGSGASSGPGVRALYRSR